MTTTTSLSSSSSSAAAAALNYSPPPSLLRRRAFSCHENDAPADADAADDDVDMNNLVNNPYQRHPLFQKQQGGFIKKLAMRENIFFGDVGVGESSPSMSPSASSVTITTADTLQLPNIYQREGCGLQSSPNHPRPRRKHVRAVSSENNCLGSVSVNSCSGVDCGDDCGDNSMSGGNSSISRLSFSTPIRPTSPATTTTTTIAAAAAAVSVSAHRSSRFAAVTPNRARANTCPRNHYRSTTATATTNTPLRHVLFRHQQHDNDIYGARRNDNIFTGESSSDEESGHGRRRGSSRDVDVTYPTLPCANNSPRLNNNNSGWSSMNRASHTHTTTSATSSFSSSPLSVSVTTQRTAAHTIHPPSSPSVLPQPSTPLPTSQGTSTSPSTTVATNTTNTNTNNNDCLLRINPTFMKLLMLLSLYILLSYTWNTDLQYRYQSMEINYGLSEYWYGGLGNSKIGMTNMAEASKKMGKSNGNGNDDGIAKKLMLLGDDGNVVAADAAADDVAAADLSASEDDVSVNEEHDGILPPLVGQQQELQQEGDVLTDPSVEEKKFRPSLSYARTVLSNPHQAAARGRQRRAIIRKKKWTLTNILWAILSFILMIPILEASMGELRRRIVALNLLRANHTILQVRYYQRWRHAFRGGERGGSTNSGRRNNVHNL